MESIPEQDLPAGDRPHQQMNPIDTASLVDLARRYVWWKSPHEALRTPERVIAQVMNIGDYSDVQSLARQVGDDVLRAVIRNAQAGQFSPKSWSYWHYRLGLANIDEVPPLPKRSFE